MGNRDSIFDTEVIAKSIRNQKALPKCVSIVSWNILSAVWYEKCVKEPQLFSFVDPKGKEHEFREYEFTAPQNGRWESRCERILRWLAEISADVIMLQEVDYHSFGRELLQPLQALGYDGLLQRQKAKRSNQPCGVATFWRRKNLSVVREHVKHCSRAMVIGLCWAHHGVGLENSSDIDDTMENTSRSESLNISKCDRAGQTWFAAANVHLEAAKSARNTRARQLNSALECIASWQRPTSQHPAPVAVLLGGDFNTGSDSSLLHVLRDRSLQGSWHGHRLAVAYEHPAAAQTLPATCGTVIFPDRRETIDHILYSHQSLKLRALLNPIDQEELAQSFGSGPNAGLPDATVPSDHIPVGALFLVETPDTNADDTVELVLAEAASAAAREAKPASPPLSVADMRAVIARVDSLGEQPPKMKGCGQPPTDQQIEAGRIYSMKLRALEASYESEGSAESKSFCCAYGKAVKKRKVEKFLKSIAQFSY
jgi:mRNA deadenylase 3'-5' endonuclease subunit Ccr4